MLTYDPPFLGKPLSLSFVQFDQHLPHHDPHAVTVDHPLKNYDGFKLEFVEMIIILFCMVLINMNKHSHF